jgi:hypothetical protein
MRAEEFDAVDYYVNEPGRTPPPPPVVGVYVDSGLSQPEFAERLPMIVADLLAVLAETVPVPMRPDESSYAVLGRAPVSRRWRVQSKLDWLADALRTGEAESFGQGFASPRDPADRSWYLEGECIPHREDTAIEVSLTPSDNLWPVEATDAIAQRLLDLVVSWTVSLDLRTACVTYDRVTPGYTPWEQWYGVNVDVMAPLTREYVRGYFWANLLTAGHLDRLGGSAELRRRAQMQGFTLHEIEAAGPAVVLRSPDPVTGFDDDQLARMKELLGPVLVPKSYDLYEGWPLRIVKDPGTAFRRVPATEPRPRLYTAEELAGTEEW